MEAYHVATQIEQRGLLAEYESAARKTVIKRKRFDRQTVILIHHTLRRQRLKAQVIGSIVAEIANHRLHDLYAFGLHVYRHHAAFLVERHRGQQPRQAEAMVPVHMGDEDMAQTREFQT